MNSFKVVLYAAWAQSLLAFMMSLYYSEIRHFAPCSLCWYQRILMYPLVILLPVALIRGDKKVYEYVLPFSLLGMITAFYHILVQSKIVPEAVLPCSNGVSCVTTYIVYFGIITIPLLSFLAFSLISGLMIFLWKGGKKQ